jgi:putative ABC transport system permease protein
MRWLLNLIRSLRVRRELAEEIEAHLAERIDDLVDAGMSQQQARAQARREFGNTGRHAESSREVWGWTWIETCLRDMLHGIRMMRRSPGFTVAATLSLTLGIGASCAIFSVLHALLLTPLPFRAPENLVEIHQTHPRLPPGYKLGTSFADLLEWKAQSTAFENFAAWNWTRHHLLDGVAPSYATGLQVSDDFFTLLGSQAWLGRTFVNDDFHSRRKVVILSHRLWMSHFGADSHVIGRTIRLDDRPYEVVGVMAADFRYPPYASQVPGMTCEMWEPMILGEQERADRKYREATVVGRIRPGYSIEQASAEMDAMMARLAEKYPESNAGWKALLVPLVDSVTEHLRPALFLLAAAVSLVLMIACANVANLLLARSTARLREIALRVSLGASQARLLTQMVSENLVLAAFGAILGLLGTHWGLRMIVPFFPHNVPRIEQIRIDGSVLAAALGMSLFTAITIAIVPVLTFRRLELGAIHCDDVAPSMLSRSFRMTNLFVVLQVAISLVLLVGAGLMIRSLAALESVDMGFRADSVLTVRLSPPGHRYRSWKQVRQFHQQALDAIRQQPGVSSAALVMTLPLSGRSVKTVVKTASTSGAQYAERNVVTPEYFRVMQIPLLQGRFYDTGDRENTDRVVIVNRRLARTLWPGDRPLGKRLLIGDDSRIVVGVVQDEKHWGVDREPEPKFYVAYDQDRNSGFLMGILTFLVVRTASDPLDAATQVRRGIWSVDRTMPLDDVKTMNQVVADSIAVPRFRTMLLAILALIALIVSMVGVYGVMAYSVTRRVRDIGINMALGATNSRILASVLFGGLRLAGLGIVIGLGLSATLSRVLENQLFGVQPLDAWAFGASAGLLMFVTVIACLIPARWATKVDPMIALRRS